MEQLNRGKISFMLGVVLYNIYLAFLMSSVKVIIASHFPDNDSKIPESVQQQAHGQGESSDVLQQQQPVVTSAPYSSSPLYLTYLAQSEQFIYQSLLDYENKLQQRLDILQRFRMDYESSVLDAMQQVLRPDEFDEWSRATLVSSHPLLAYRMIRRYSKDLQAFTEHIWQSLENELWETLELRRNKKFAWPTQEDLLAAAKSLIRLQDTHDFDIHQFTDGVIKDHHIKVGLTARQCLEISETALEMGEINTAVEWFQAAHAKGINGHDSSISMDELTQAWEKTYQAFQSIWPMHIFSTHDVFSEAKEMLRNNFNRLKQNQTKEHTSIQFKALCRGEKFPSERHILDSTCYLENTIHPYHFIDPLRIELYSTNPVVYQVHDFLTVKAIVIKNLSNVVVSSMVSATEAGVADFQAESWSKSYTHSFLHDHTSPLLSALAEKIRGLSDHYISHKFKTVTSDEFQISAYAVGSHYEPCMECFKLESDLNVTNIGRVVSTAHIVLHAPEKGGELVFPLLGVAVTPSVGYVIIPNEMDFSGSIDERSIHGACPVLIGEKWVATKVIYEKVPKPSMEVKKNSQNRNDGD